MTLMNKFLTATSALALAVLLACGGGGGSTPPPPVPAVAPTISTQPASQAVNTGATATFSVIATGTAPLSYQWNKGGATITSATSASYSLAAAALTDSGSYTVTVSNSAGSVTSTAAILTVSNPNVLPSISSEPISASVIAGSAATFSVIATGSPLPTFQWYRNNVAISGATNSSYTLAITTLADNGSVLTVQVSNVAGTITSNAAVLTVTSLPVAPSISIQPSNLSVLNGSSATFAVTADGTAPLSYQWKKAGAPINGATSSNYTIATAQTADSGTSYSVTITNSAGSITSSNATLTVVPNPIPPTISTQPSNQTVMQGASASFNVTVDGTAPFTYQWKKNGVSILGATFPVYSTPVTTAADNGSTYSVFVSNSAGSVTSSAATLTVVSAASLAYTDPTTGTYLLKKNVALSTATHLVLDLVGPAATSGTGVLATLSADTTKVTWVNVAATDAANTFVQNGTAFSLGTGTQILKGKVIGNVLQAVAAQKGTGLPVALNAPLLRVALDLKASQPAGAITFTADGTKCQVLDGTAGSPTTITVSVGTLTAQ